MVRLKEDITIEYLREVFSYDPVHGQIRRKSTGALAFIGKNSAGHLVGSILNRQYRASRVAWALHYGEWPGPFVSHLNGVFTDNRITNLTLRSGNQITAPEQRFQAYLGPKLENGCIEWQGGLGRGGYGKFRASPDKKHSHVGAHRFAYEMANGPIPDGLFVCHSCDNRRCCNPDHLWLGTANDNVQDMVAKGRHIRERTHCGHGHELTEDNRVKRLGAPSNRCKTCAREIDRRWRERRRRDGDGEAT